MGKKRLSHILSIVTSVAILISVVPASVSAATRIYYRDENGNEVNTTSYTTLSANTTQWDEGTYYLGSTITVSDRIEVNGYVKLILGPQKTLHALSGVHVPYGSYLTIYTSTSGAGILNCFTNAEGLEGYSALGADPNEMNGRITIAGGNVYSRSGYGAAGIGSGCFDSREAFEQVEWSAGGEFDLNLGEDPTPPGPDAAIYVYDGNVDVTGGTDAAGIGGGRFSDSGRFICLGGTVKATGNGDGAGIGGGYCGCITLAFIRGGDVTAMASGKGAGIGDGNEASFTYPGKPRVYIMEQTRFDSELGDTVVTRTSTVEAISVGNGSPFIFGASESMPSELTAGDLVYAFDDALIFFFDYVDENHITNYYPTMDIEDILNCNGARIMRCRHHNISYEMTETGHTMTCPVCHKTSEEQEHKWGADGVCTVCGYSYPAMIVSANVFFEGKVQLRYTMCFSQTMREDQEAYVTFTRNGKVTKQKISDVETKNVEGMYITYFYLPVPAPEFGDEILMYVYNGAGEKQSLVARDGTSFTENGFPYSVKQYAENMHNNPAHSDMNDLAVATYEYGRAACAYFGGNTGSWTPLDGYTQPEVTEADLYGYAIETDGARPYGIDKMTIRDFFESDNTLRITVYLKDDVSNFSFKVDDEDDYTPIWISENVYALDVPNIAAAELHLQHTFIITRNDAPDETYTVRASALSYALTSMKNGSPERRQLGIALYLYNLAAVDYFKGNI